ncbi:conserved hypothetical protein [Talaromyces stipitatus ATCC 10500]|uniref:Aminoglycoside phosphotransferase domain-containing protein n=1 Tax=Talaromyces stipitatus (strain ATCC 10500 / CBS 375.48 / QM 6759 / NRRL 1006) TaxID=441959 RepID=B8MK00_TALSN|nr:uncharacterized protein TSTA_042890 [Talaromyces stipitatus ATCC 10500]EED14817.1 conserved hypothetical protein [Talaromyces stipitatus ATCC 10500]
MSLKIWRQNLFNEKVLREIGGFVIRHRGSPAEELFNPQKVSFNIMSRMKFLDGGSAMIRFPIPAVSMFPEEKAQQEMSVMRFIERHTSICVPYVLYYGMADRSPVGPGPFIIMEFIENDSDLVDALNTPGLQVDERCILDPNVPEDRLADCDRHIVIWQISYSSWPENPFNEIGSIKNQEDDDFDDEWVAAYRPLTLNMNELVQLGGLPLELLPQTFRTASAYLLALAEMRMPTYLYSAMMQSNHRKTADANISLDVCSGNWPEKIAYVLTIRVPSSFSVTIFDPQIPPSWLLLERPEYWKGVLGEWTGLYGRRLPFDRRFFGDGDLEDRLELLTSTERNTLDVFVKRKLAEKNARTL